MKTDREFIEGIYAKAEKMEEQNTVKPFDRKIHIFRIVAPVAMAACALLIFLGISINNQRIEPPTGADRANPAGYTTEAPVDENIYSIKGRVITILEAHDGYGFMKVRMSSDSEYMSEITMDIAYNSSQVYSVDDIVEAEVKKIMIENEECLVIVQ